MGNALFETLGGNFSNYTPRPLQDHKKYIRWRITVGKLEMEGDLNVFVNGRRPQLVLFMEDDLIFVNKWKTKLNLFVHGRQPKIF